MQNIKNSKLKITVIGIFKLAGAFDPIIMKNASLKIPPIPSPFIASFVFHINAVLWYPQFLFVYVADGSGHFVKAAVWNGAKHFHLYHGCRLGILTSLE